jgi:hypothetical protein
VHVHRRRDEQVQDDEFRREQRGEHVAVKPVKTVTGDPANSRRGRIQPLL